MSVLQQQLQSEFFVFFRQYTNESKTSAVDLEIKSLREMTQSSLFSDVWQKKFGQKLWSGFGFAADSFFEQGNLICWVRK